MESISAHDSCFSCGSFEPDEAESTEGGNTARSTWRLTSVMHGDGANLGSLITKHLGRNQTAMAGVCVRVCVFCLGVCLSVCASVCVRVCMRVSVYLSTCLSVSVPL